MCLSVFPASTGVRERIRTPIAILGAVLSLTLGGCGHADLSSEFKILGSGQMGQGTDVTLILDKKKIDSPGEIAPDRAMILISIDTSSYRGESPARAIFDITVARLAVDGGEGRTVAHVDKNNRSHGTITSPDSHGTIPLPGLNFFSCWPSPHQITLAQAPGLLRDYVLSFPAGYVIFTLREAATVRPYLRDRPSRVFDYQVPGFAAGGPTDLGTFRIQGPQGAASVVTDDSRAASGTMHWRDIRFRAAPMVYEITPPPVVWEMHCLDRPGF